MLYDVKVIRLNLFDYWAGYDLALVESAHAGEACEARGSTRTAVGSIAGAHLKTVSESFRGPYAS
jgi:hypothetical protein